MLRPLALILLGCVCLVGAENLLPVPTAAASNVWKDGAGSSKSGQIWKQGWSGNAWDASTEGAIGIEQTEQGLALFVRNLAGRDAMQLYPAKPVLLKAGSSYRLSFRYRCLGGGTGVVHYQLKGEAPLQVVEHSDGSTDSRLQLSAADWTPFSARFTTPAGGATPEFKLNIQYRGKGPDTGFQIVELALAPE